MGVTERRLREKEARRTTIMDAAEKVFFTDGVDRAKMDDVAEQAELSKGLLYFYFQNKHDLAHAIAHRGLRVLEQLFSEVLQEDRRGVDLVRLMGDTYVKFSQDYPDYFGLISWVQSQPSDEWGPGSHAERCEIEGDRCIELVAVAVQRGIDDQSIRDDIDPLETAIILWAQTHGLIQIASFKHAKGKFRITPERLTDRAMTMMALGFASDAVRDEGAATANETDAATANAGTTTDANTGTTSGSGSGSGSGTTYGTTAPQE